MADDTVTVAQARLAYDNAVVSTFDAVTPAERLQCEADVKQAWDALIAAVRAENAPLKAADHNIGCDIFRLRPCNCGAWLS